MQPGLAYRLRLILAWERNTSAYRTLEGKQSPTKYRFHRLSEASQILQVIRTPHCDNRANHDLAPGIVVRKGRKSPQESDGIQRIEGVAGAALKWIRVRVALGNGI